MARRRARLEELEPRVLLSADAAALALPTLDPADAERQRFESDSQASQQATTHELVFVDEAIDDWETLVADLVDERPGERAVRVVVLDADRDGLEQISQALAASAVPLDAVHVLSHGTETGLQLGGTWLDRGELSSRSELVEGWRGALGEEADLLLYGCNLAASEAGKGLVDQLASLTGADVAASTDLTGAAALGGDWELEHATGVIETPSAISASAQARFAGVLEGTAIFRLGSSTTPFAAEFDGAFFSPGSGTVNVGSQWQIVQGAEAPTRDEKIVVGVDAAGNLSGVMWDGSQWTPLPFNNLERVNDSDYFAFDIAYESRSGEAMLVYANDGIGSNSLSYRTWNGTSWSSETTFTSPLAGEPLQLQLAASPHSDEMVLVVTENGKSDYAAVWDGDSWGNPILLNNDSGAIDFVDGYVAYEQQSGHAMVIYGRASNTAFYRIWDGTSWSAEQPLVSAPGAPGQVMWSTLASDPGSDRIVAGVITEAGETWLSVWDGNSWGNAILATDFGFGVNFKGVDVAFESSSGTAVAVYSSPFPQITYRTWTPGAGWSGELYGPALNGDPTSILLEADPDSDDMMLAVQDEFSELAYHRWNGSSFGGWLLRASSTGETEHQPFTFLWDVDRDNLAPILTPVSPTFTSITEDDTTNPGELVSDLLGGSAVDPEGNPVGIAIAGKIGGRGTWQFSTDDGASWSDVGTVSIDAALLLRDTDRLRYLPDGIHADTASIGYLAWDQSSGSVGSRVDVSSGGGSSPFSTDGDVATIDVTAVNDAPVLAPSAPGLTGIDEDDLSNNGDRVGSLLAGSVLDVDPGSARGIAVTGLAPGNGTWQFSTDAGGSWTDVPAVSGTSALLLRANDRIRFVPDGLNADNARFDFVAWDRTSGSAGTLANPSPAGGTGAFSLQENTASIDVAAVNDAPRLSPVAIALPPVDEDDVDNAGSPVSTLLGAGLSEDDLGDPGGIAVTRLSPSSGHWEFSLDDGGSWSDVPAVAPSSALLLRETDRIRFVPDGAAGEIASFEFAAWDQSSGNPGTLTNALPGGGTSAFSTGVARGQLVVLDANDAPILTPGSPSLTSIDEDDVDNPGDLVSNLLGGSVRDPDGASTMGIAITALASGNGTWQFSTDGGAGWNDMGSVSPATALLLRGSDRVRFVPDGENADSASFDFLAWDGSSGTAGGTASTGVVGTTTPFSVASDTASIDVTAVNDAPVLTPSAPALTPITEDDTSNPGDRIDILLGSSVSDVDAGDPLGIAITGLDPGNGTWQFSIDDGATWSDVGSVSTTSALLLSEDDRVRFVPDGLNADSAHFDFVAWDESVGLPGNLADATATGTTTPFSTASDRARIVVGAVNEAPVLTPSAPALTPITEDETGNPGDRVGALLGTSVRDDDLGDPLGIAITGLASGNGSWQFSTDDGASWSDVGSASIGSALLLRDTDRVRFVPDGENADTAHFDFVAWDRSGGNAGLRADASIRGGTSPFSNASDTARIDVTAVNDAPVLDASGTMTLSDVPESTPSPAGDPVAAILASAGGDRVTDVDNGDPEGIAVIGVDDSNGSWQYSTDDGVMWTAFGTVSDGAAVLLDEKALVRFVPDVGWFGSSGDIRFRAWDQSNGASGQTGVDASANGSTTAFSAATESASLTVTARNFAPVLTPSAPSLTAIDEDAVSNPGDRVGSLVAGSVSDLDPLSPVGIAITGLASGNGSWQFSTDAGGSWTDIGNVSDRNALLLRDVDHVRFVPDGLNGDRASFDFRAWDQSAGGVGARADASVAGGAAAFSMATDTATIDVGAVNDSPSIRDASLASVSSDDTDPPGARVGSLFRAGFSDVDTGARLSGVAVIGNAADPATQGEWQYSSDGGTSWAAVGRVGDDGSALALSRGTLLRFVPVSSFDGSVALDVRGLDDAYAGTFSATTAGVETRANVDASAHGGTSSISGSAASLATLVTPGTTITDGDPNDLDPDPEPDPDPVEEPEPADPTPDEPETEPPAEEPETPLGPPLAGPGDEGGGTVDPVDPSGPAPVSAAPSFARPIIPGDTDPRFDENEEERATAATRTALDVLRDVYLGRSSIGADTLTSLIFNGQRLDFMGELDASQEDLLALSQLETTLVSSTVAVTSGLSVGYVLWLTRGGLLIASLLTSLPAWRLVDPIPILAHLGSDDEEGGHGDDSLGSMLEREDEEPEPGTLPT